jgi:hypothetical protein
VRASPAGNRLSTLALFAAPATRHGLPAAAPHGPKPGLARYVCAKTGLILKNDRISLFF